MKRFSVFGMGLSLFLLGFSAFGVVAQPDRSMMHFGSVLIQLGCFNLWLSLHRSYVKVPDES
jgi:hypothetical protein